MSYEPRVKEATRTACKYGWGPHFDADDNHIPKTLERCIGVLNDISSLETSSLVKLILPQVTQN